MIAVSEATEDKTKEEVQMDQKKVRAVAVGVADLMKSLKTRRKGLVDKGKIKQGKVGSTALEGLHPSPSL